jgi:hypothetical protein
MKRMPSIIQRRQFPLVAVMLLTFAFAGSPGTLWPEPATPKKDKAKDPKQAKPVKKDKIYRVTYDAADLLQPTSSMSWILDARVQGGSGGLEFLAEYILTRSANPENWREEGKYTLRVVNGTKLEVRANATEHAQIAGLLTALRQLADVAVVVDVHLYAVERDFYQKEVQPKLPKRPGKPGPLSDTLAQKIAKQGTLVKSNKRTIHHMRDTNFFSLQKTLFYRAKATGGKKDTAEGFKVAFYGMSFHAHALVSPDRRRIRLQVRQQMKDLAGIYKEKDVDPQTKRETTIERPNWREASSTATLQVDDGEWLLVPVLSRPKSGKLKDRVLVLLVRPMIYIEEEERIRKKGR